MGERELATARALPEIARAPPAFAHRGQFFCDML